MNFQEFDDRMWDNFAGAEGWVGGYKPICGEFILNDKGKDKNAMIVIDKNGVMLLIEDDKTNICGGYHIMCEVYHGDGIMDREYFKFPNQAMAKSFMITLPASADKEEFIKSYCFKLA